MATTLTATKNALFVQVPVSVLEAEMPDSHKIGFQRLIYKCFREHSDQVRGSYRGLAKLLKVAKTSLIRMLPLWAKAGWIFFEKNGKELIITLRNLLQVVPPRDTAEADVSPTEPARDKDVPPRDESVPTLSSILPVISNTTDTLLLTLSKEISNNVSSLTVPPRDTENVVPELTPELVLQLSSQVLPVPLRPAGGPELERWMKAWYTAAQDLIADYAPVTGPLAWREMDEVNRFTASPESGWMKKIGRLPTLENIRNTLHIQREQMARLGGWQPEQRTPYPGVPLWDDQQDVQLLAQQELDVLVAAILAPEPEQTVPTRDNLQEEAAFQDTVPDIREAQPFAPGKLKLYADSLLVGNPELILSSRILDGSGRRRLLAKIGPDQYIGIDPEIWEDPTPDEEALIVQAIDYGTAQRAAQREAVTI